ncbi:MAG: hypothetical protein RLZZ628_2042 [Bacteroidota bacterium]
MKHRYFSASALVLLTGLLTPAVAQHDDVYYDPQPDRPSDTRLPQQQQHSNTTTVEQTGQMTDYSNTNATHYDDLQYYDDEYADDYAYSSRIRRYRRPMNYAYYDNYYMDPFRYDPYFYDRLYYRPQFVISFGRPSFWNAYSYRPMYNSWYDYSFNSWNPYFSSPWGCNSYYGWNNYYGYNSYSYYNTGYYNSNRSYRNDPQNYNNRHWNPNGTYTGARTVGSSISPSSPRSGRETLSPRNNNGGTYDNRPTSSGRMSANPPSTTPIQRGGDMNTTRISPTRTYERPTRTESVDSRPTRTYERPAQTTEQQRPARTYERPSQPQTYERSAPVRSESRSMPSQSHSAPSRSESHSAPAPSRSSSGGGNSGGGGRSNSSHSSPRGHR